MFQVTLKQFLLSEALVTVVLCAFEVIVILIDRERFLGYEVLSTCNDFICPTDWRCSFSGRAGCGECGCNAWSSTTTTGRGGRRSGTTFCLLGR